MSHNANIPFSWELKPGVSKVTHEEQRGIGIIKHVAVNLPPPPCLSKSARFCVDGLNGVLPMEKKGDAINKKQGDPFVAAFRKCTEYSTNDKSGTDDKIDACKNRIKKNMFVMSCKYSCNISRCNVKSVSVFEGRSQRKKHG